MTTLCQLVLRFLALFRRDRLDSELHEEMSAHLALAIDDHLKSGMSREEARRQALIDFGPQQQAEENHRDARSLPLIETLMQDLRYTFRTLRKDPSFTAIAMLILTLGIGANIVVFSVVNTLLLRSLPFPHSEQLVWFAGNHGQGGLSATTYNVGYYEEARRHSQSFQDITCYQAFWGSSAYNMTPSEEARKDEPGTAIVRLVTPGYLQAMGIHLVSGRDLSWQDIRTHQPVAVINQTAARLHWPGQNPVDRPASGFSRDQGRIIGVVSDVRVSSLEASPGPEMYLPANIDPEGAELVVRSRLTPEALTASVMPILRQLNPTQPNNSFRPVQFLVDRSVSPRRFFVYLVGVFATLGLILAALGIYGVISYSVTRQTQEIGIRMALGATPADIQRSILARTLKLAASGIAVGAAASVVASQIITSLLFHTEPNDPITFLAVMTILVLVAVVAGFFPALRATRIDPAIALRSE